MKSETTKSLADALSKAQGGFSPIKRTEQVSYQTTKGLKKYKYAPLPNVLDSIRKALLDNGLAISQVPKIEGDKLVIETLILHNSGEWLSGDMVVCNDNLPPQEKGSALTYARRYALSSLLGLAADEDDDASIATKPEKTEPKPAPPPPKVDPRLVTYAEEVKKPTKESEASKITPAQTKKIYASVKEKGITADQAKTYLKDVFKKMSTKELTISEASRLIEDINAGKLEVKEEGHLVEAAKALGAVEIKDGE